MNITPLPGSLHFWGDLHRLTFWEGVALVGSYAREAATEDSDVDLMILTFERARYFENQDWLSLFGEIERATNETWGAVNVIRAIYKLALKSNTIHSFHAGHGPQYRLTLRLKGS